MEEKIIVKGAREPDRLDVRELAPVRARAGHDVDHLVVLGRNGFGEHLARVLTDAFEEFGESLGNLLRSRF